MQRYFVHPKQIANQDQMILITGDDVHHISRVMRLRPGDEVVCCDGMGLDYLTEIIRISPDAVLCRILQQFPSKGEPRTQITIAQSIPKGDKMDWILQKGTELGCSGFLPFFSERTIVKLDPKKRRQRTVRWQRIVKEAAEQAQRGKIPTVSVPLTWQELLQEIKRRQVAWLLYEKGGIPIKQALADTQENELLVIIGPEGGFSDQEVEEAKENGAIPVSLGERILRTETASLVALTCIQFAKSELGGEKG